MPKIRMSVTEEVKARLEEVCKRTNLDLTEVFQRALSLYDFLTQDDIEEVYVKDKAKNLELLDISFERDSSGG